MFAKKEKTTRRKAPKTVQESIPFKNLYENGVIETEDGVFTKAYRLMDVDFNLASDDKQMAIYKLYGSFLNSFSSNISFQMLIVNRDADKRVFLRGVQFAPQKDGLNRYRQQLNNVLLGKMAEGKNNLTQEKYCIVSVTENQVDTAMQILESVDRDIDTALKQINPGATTKPLSLVERLKCLHGIYNQDGESVFENALNDRDERIFSVETLYKQGLNIKDAIAPSSMQFKDKYFTLGNSVGRSFTLDSVPSYLTTKYISDLANLPYKIIISTHYSPIEPLKSQKMIKAHLMDLNAQITTAQKKAGNEGYSAEVISPELYRQQKQTMSLLNDLTTRDQKLYYVTVVVTAFADDLAMLDRITREITACANIHMAPLRRLVFQQERGFNASLPLAINEVYAKKLMTTESGAVFLPYSSKDLHQKGGNYYGNNQLTKSMITYNRTSSKNYNGLIFGQSGSGKSYAAKAEMLSTMLRSENNVVYIIDPEDEYSTLTKALGGEVINISSGANLANGSLPAFLNPLDIDLDYSGDEDPVAMKSDYIISLFEILMGKHAKIDPRQKSIIDRCVVKIYQGYMQHIHSLNAQGKYITYDRDAMPTLKNLYEELTLQPEPEAKYLASVLETYAKGSLQTFAHRSTVDSDARMICYNIHQLGSGMKNLGLYVCLNEVWNKMLQNKKKGKNIYTYIYIDEFYLLLQSESAAAYLTQIWKRARKWNGAATGILQGTNDLMRSAEARDIINNSDMVMMLSLPEEDRERLGDMLDLSEYQLEYIKNSQPGTGLLYTSQGCVPFNNVYPMDTDLHVLMSTTDRKSERERYGFAYAQ